MIYYKMPESGAQVRSRERREEQQQQQELLNTIRDNNSIFRDGQMQEKPDDVAKDWMTQHPGDSFLNLVARTVEHNKALTGLIKQNSSKSRKINDINDMIIEIDNRSDLFVDSLGDLESEQKDMNKILAKLLKETKQASKPPDNSRVHAHIDQLEKNVSEKFKGLKKMSVWAEQYSKQTSKTFSQHVNRLDQQEKEIRELQQDKRDLKSDKRSMMDDILELQKQHRELLKILTAKEGSVAVKKGSMKKSKKKSKRKSTKRKSKKKKSTKRKRSKKRR